MQEQLVSFKTAKLLKEKGFNEPTIAYTYGKDKIDYFSKPKLVNEDSTAIQSPTIGFAIQWLRETRNVQVEPYKNKFGWHFTVYNLNDTDMSGCKKLFEESIFNAGRDSYEDAAEAGINYYLTHDLECIL